MLRVLLRWRTHSLHFRSFKQCHAPFPTCALLNMCPIQHAPFKRALFTYGYTCTNFKHYKSNDLEYCEYKWYDKLRHCHFSAVQIRDLNKGVHVGNAPCCLPTFCLLSFSTLCLAFALMVLVLLVVPSWFRYFEFVPLTVDHCLQGPTRAYIQYMSSSRFNMAAHNIMLHDCWS